MSYDSTHDTIEHIKKVQGYLKSVSVNLDFRGEIHDASKLRPPEKTGFDEVTSRLHDLVYGSDEYNDALSELGDILELHYARNDHHPQGNKRGINGMSLMSIMEMLCDWKAATERMKDGDFQKSLEINKERFDISDQLYDVLVNTSREMGWITLDNEQLIE